MARLEKDPQASEIPESIKALLGDFQKGLGRTLGENLVGLYFFGSVAFPGFEPHRADIDFHAVVRRDLSPQETKDLDALHGSLKKQHRYGGLLDGFYIPASKVRLRAVPTGLTGAAHGHLAHSVSDDAWALHREHLRRGACIILHGPEPKELYPPASWREIEGALYQALDDARESMGKNPVYSVLNLCRLVYSLQSRDAVLSKIQGAEWGMRNLPTQWRPLLHAALRNYRRKGGPSGRGLVAGQVADFYDYASRRIADAEGTRP